MGLLDSAISKWTWGMLDGLWQAPALWWDLAKAGVKASTSPQARQAVFDAQQRGEGYLGTLEAHHDAIDEELYATYAIRAQARAAEFGNSWFGPDEGFGALVGDTSSRIRQHPRGDAAMDRVAQDAAELQQWVGAAQRGINRVGSFAITQEALEQSPQRPPGWWDQMKLSWGMAEGLSPMQALYLSQRTTDILDPQQVEAAANDPLFPIITGIGDALWAWWADPTVVGGKTLKIANQVRQVPLRSANGLRLKTWHKWKNGTGIWMKSTRAGAPLFKRTVERIKAGAHRETLGGYKDADFDADDFDATAEELTEAASYLRELAEDKALFTQDEVVELEALAEQLEGGVVDDVERVSRALSTPDGPKILRRNTEQAALHYDRLIRDVEDAEIRLRTLGTLPIEDLEFQYVAGTSDTMPSGETWGTNRALKRGQQTFRVNPLSALDIAQPWRVLYGREGLKEAISRGLDPDHFEALLAEGYNRVTRRHNDRGRRDPLPVVVYRSRIPDNPLLKRDPTAVDGEFSFTASEIGELQAYADLGYTDIELAIRDIEPGDLNRLGLEGKWLPPDKSGDPYRRILQSYASRQELDNIVNARAQLDDAKNQYNHALSLEGQFLRRARNLTAAELDLAAGAIANHFFKDMPEVHARQIAYNIAAAPDGDVIDALLDIYAGSPEGYKLMDQLAEDRARIQANVEALRSLDPDDPLADPDAYVDRVRSTLRRVQNEQVFMRYMSDKQSAAARSDARFELLNEPHAREAIDAEIRDQMRLLKLTENLSSEFGVLEKAPRATVGGWVYDKFLNTTLRTSHGRSPVTIVGNKVGAAAQAFHREVMRPYQDVMNPDILDQADSVLHYGGIARAEAEGWKNRLALARDPQERVQIWNDMVYRAFTNIMEEFGLDDMFVVEQLLEWVRVGRGQNLAVEKIAEAIRNGEKAIRFEGQNGYFVVPVDHIHDPDGVVLTPDLRKARELARYFSQHTFPKIKIRPKGETFPAPPTRLRDLTPEVERILALYDQGLPESLIRSMLDARWTYTAEDMLLRSHPEFLHDFYKTPYVESHLLQILRSDYPDVYDAVSDNFEVRFSAKREFEGRTEHTQDNRYLIELLADDSRPNHVLRFVMYHELAHLITNIRMGHWPDPDSTGAGHAAVFRNTYMELIHKRYPEFHSELAKILTDLKVSFSPNQIDADLDPQDWNVREMQRWREEMARVYKHRAKIREQVARITVEKNRDIKVTSPSAATLMQESAVDMFDAFTSLWKAEVLLAPRWTIKVVGEEQVRQIMHFGMGTYLREHARIEPYRNMAARTVRTIGMRRGRRASVVAGALGTIVGGPAVGAAVGAGSLALLETMNKVAKLGYGDLVVNGMKIDHGLGNGSKQNIRRLITAENQSDFLDLPSRTRFGVSKLLGRSGRRLTVTPDDPEWMGSVLNALNGTLGQDAMAKMIMNGATADDVLTWLRTSEGKQYSRGKREVLTADPEGWVSSMFTVTHDLTGGFDNRIVQKLLTGKKVESFDLEAVWPDPKTRPVFNHEAVDQTQGTANWQKGLQKNIKDLFKIFSAIPSDEMSRIPTFRASLREGWIGVFGGDNLDLVPEVFPDRPHWNDYRKYNDTQSRVNAFVQFSDDHGSLVGQVVAAMRKGELTDPLEAVRTTSTYHSARRRATEIERVGDYSVGDFDADLLLAATELFNRTEIPFRLDEPMYTVWRGAPDNFNPGDTLPQTQLVLKHGDATPRNLGANDVVIEVRNARGAHLGGNKADVWSEGAYQVVEWDEFTRTLVVDQIRVHAKGRQKTLPSGGRRVNEEDNRSFTFTQAQYEAVVNRLRERAVYDTNRLLYNLAARTEFQQMNRILGPFFAAAQEIATTWARMFIHRPDRIARMALIWEGLTNAEELVYTDEFGQRHLIFPIPEFAKSFVENGILQNAFDHQGEIKLNLDSLIPWNELGFGIGPIASIMYGAVTNRRPDLEESASLLFNFGVPQSTSEVVKSLMPAYLRRLYSAATQDDHFEKAVLANIMTKMVDMREGEIDPIDLNDPAAQAQFIQDTIAETRQQYAVWSFASWVSPSAVGFESPYKYFIDEAYRMRREDPDNAFRNFIALHGEDMAVLYNSLTKTNDGVPPTMEAWKSRNEHEDLILRYPEWAGFVTGADAADNQQTAYSVAVADYQERHETFPGSGVYQRQTKTPGEFIAEPGVRLGWLEYSRLNDWIDAQLDQRGLYTTQQAAAQDLAQIRQAAIEKLEEKYPAWALDRQERLKETDKWEKIIAGARVVVATPELYARADTKAIEKYLTIRDHYVRQLKDRPAKTLRATSNADLREEFELVIGKLIMEDVNFGPVYRRYFEFDYITAGDDF